MSEPAAAPDQRTARRRQRRKEWTIVVLAGLLFLVIVGIVGAHQGGGSSSSSDDTSQVGAAQSDLACRHFRNVMSDVSQGILTNAELRQKLIEVHNDALIATQDVQAAAAHMLADITAGDEIALERDLSAMSAACSAAGQ